VRGDLDKAREGIRDAFGLDALNPGALELLGDIFLSEAEQEKAIQVLQRGAQAHPHLPVFEEKIALALLDIDEEKRDREAAALLLELGDRDRWTERKPAAAATLSLLIPGAGQVYNDEAERGGVLFGAALVTFGGWYYIFDRATSSLAGGGSRQLMQQVGGALEQMGVLAKLGFWVFLLGWLAVVGFAAWDAYSGAIQANRARRPFGV
jgi:tetratricopeptide (TPR) repeat protein